MSASNQDQTPAGPDLTPDDKRLIAEASLERQLSWIRAVENKLTVLVAIDAGLLGLLATITPSRSELSSLSSLFTFLTSASLVGSFACCALASYPRLKTPNLSLLFFGTISAFSREEYSDKFESVSAQQYLRDLLAQVHRNAEIAAYKYKLVGRANVGLLAGIAFWTLALMSF